MNDHARIAVRVVDVYPYRVRDVGIEYLLLRRAPGRSYAGQWRMVGGKIEESETAAESALREFQEETGLHPITAWALPSPNIFYDWRDDRINIAPAFAVEAAGEPVLNAEHEEFRWHPVERAIERLVYPEQRRLVRMIEHTLKAGIPPEWLISATHSD